jgi:hypothetical protein
LPTQQGGLGLGSAQLTSRPAFLASWIDFLRFNHARPSFIPALTSTLSPSSLASNLNPDIVQLRLVWSGLVARLTRPDPSSGIIVGGEYELRNVLGAHVHSVSDLATAKSLSQKDLTTLCMRALEREWRDSASKSDRARLTDCGGREAAWVTRCPTRPEYRVKNPLWRVALLTRLALPLPHLRARQPGCVCHDRFDSHAHDPGRRRLKRPAIVDALGEHDQRCPLTFTLGRHDEVQESALRPTLKANGIHVSNSKTSELRKPGDFNDKCRRKGDLTATGLFHPGKDILDVGITHPTIDSSINHLSSEVRGAAANRYAATKDRRANATIKAKGLDVSFLAITFGSYGAFGKSAHRLIAKATADAPVSVFNPWVKPGPKAHAYLLFGFSLARANARMLINADSKRRSARNSVRASRPQSTSSVAVHG